MHRFMPLSDREYIQTEQKPKAIEKRFAHWLYLAFYPSDPPLVEVGDPFQFWSWK